MKPRYTMRKLLLEAMQACPEGKRLVEYAAEIKRDPGNTEEAALMLCRLGQAVRVRVHPHTWWTAAEHAGTMAAAAEAEKARKLAELEASGVLAQRKARLKERKREAVIRHRERQKSAKPVKRGPERYPWPDEVYSEPARPVRSVWEWACM